MDQLLTRAGAPEHEASSPIVIRLAGEPRGKGRHRSRLIPAKGPRPSFIANHPDPKTEMYESHLRVAAQEVMGDRPLLAGPLVVAVFAYMTIPASWPEKRKRLARSEQLRPVKKPDADNLIKTLDALNKVVWDDDVQIVRAFVEKVYSDRPALVIRVEPWLPPALLPAAAALAPMPGLFAGATP